MNIGNAENVQKLVQFYINNAMSLANATGIEADAEIKIRIVPNFDKNIDAKFVVVGSGKIVMPGKEEALEKVAEYIDKPEEAPVETTEEEAKEAENVTQLRKKTK